MFRLIPALVSKHLTTLPIVIQDVHTVRRDDSVGSRDLSCEMAIFRRTNNAMVLLFSRASARVRTRASIREARQVETSGGGGFQRAKTHARGNGKRNERKVADRVDVPRRRAAARRGASGRGYRLVEIYSSSCNRVYDLCRRWVPRPFSTRRDRLMGKDND